MNIKIVTLNKQIEQELEEIRRKFQDTNRSNPLIAFVPTMGALHEGHVALLRSAKQQAQFVVSSLYVNPKQFQDQNDFKLYPHRLDNDLKLLEKEDIDFAFIPNDEEIYPDDFSTEIRINNQFTNIMEGKIRPGYFSGVATVLMRLFMIIRPDIALFGEKDYQQLLLAKQLVKDLCIKTEIKSLPTVRDEFGLPWSSRNFKLNSEEKNIATQIPAVIFDLAERLRAYSYNSDPRIADKFGITSNFTAEKYGKPKPLPSLFANAKKNLLDLGVSSVDYFELRHADLRNSELKYPLQKDVRIFIALMINKIRLIDNIPIFN